jgi:hypothetical protein
MKKRCSCRDAAYACSAVVRSQDAAWAGFYHIRFGGSLTDRIDAHANLIKPGGIFLPAGTALSESYDNRTGQYGDAVAPIGCIASYEVL